MAYFFGQLLACFMVAIFLAVVVAFVMMAIAGIGAFKFWIAVAIITLILLMITSN